jgi:transcription elongation factor Elf1
MTLAVLDESQLLTVHCKCCGAEDEVRTAHSFSRSGKFFCAVLDLTFVCDICGSRTKVTSSVDAPDIEVKEE